MRIKLLSVLTIILFSLGLNAQSNPNSDNKSTWHISAGYGIQMSGIKDEDFIKSNYSPLLDISIGKWFAPSLAVRFGYNGWYFNTISHTFSRPYGFYYGQVVFNVNKLIKPSKDYKLNFLLHLGAGYFYNYYYDRPNICANLAFTLDYHLSRKWSVNFCATSVMGWDIYQNNEDILPGLKLGLTYSI